MTEEEVNTARAFIESAYSKGDTTGLMASIADSLVVIAAAQEKMLELAVQDMEGQIEEAVDSRAKDLAEQMEADKAKRSFIGKK